MSFIKRVLEDSLCPDNLKTLEVTIKRTRKIIPLIMLGILAVLLLTNGWFTVSEQENAVVTTAGQVTAVKGAGLHFKIPILQSVQKVDMTTRGMEVGYTTAENVQLTVPNDEPFDQRNSIMITNDFNMVSVDFYAEWRVTDPVKFLYSSHNPVEMLNNINQSSARDVVSALGVDRVLTDGKSEIQSSIKELVSSVLDTYDIGIMVTNIIVQDSEPPTMDVTAAFKAVEDAKQGKDTLINEASRYYNEIIPGARADADRITKGAEAAKESRINEAKGQVARFNQMFSEYSNNPDITKARMYLEAMESILPDLKVYIDGSNNDGLLKILDLTRQEE